MQTAIVREPLTSLGSYAGISAAFIVERIAEVEERPDEAGRFHVRERPLATPYLKDYDAADGGGPIRWPARFDVSCWALLAAYVDSRRVGGAAVAFNTPELTDGREDLAVLWDIRVHPEARGRGVGSALLRAAEACAVARGCRQLLAETQNINLRACRFYARHGCVLRAANRLAYPDLPEEIQLLWYKDL